MSLDTQSERDQLRSLEDTRRHTFRSLLRGVLVEFRDQVRWRRWRTGHDLALGGAIDRMIALIDDTPDDA